MQNSIAGNDVKQNNECASSLWLDLKQLGQIRTNVYRQHENQTQNIFFSNLDEFVPWGRNLFPSSCLEVGDARRDVLALHHYDDIDDNDGEDDDDGDNKDGNNDRY